jgi:hypothetical protein
VDLWAFMEFYRVYGEITFEVMAQKSLQAGGFEIYYFIKHVLVSNFKDYRSNGYYKGNHSKRSIS